MKQHLVAYKRPRRLFVVPALPRLASGKVDKVDARRLAQLLVDRGPDPQNPQNAELGQQLDEGVDATLP